jgi:hypothetical protein
MNAAEDDRRRMISRLHRAASEYLVDAMVTDGVVNILHSLDRSEEYEKKVLEVVVDPREKVVAHALLSAIHNMRALYLNVPQDS